MICILLNKTIFQYYNPQTKNNSNSNNSKYHHFHWFQWKFQWSRMFEWVNISLKLLILFMVEFKLFKVDDFWCNYKFTLWSYRCLDFYFTKILKQQWTITEFGYCYSVIRVSKTNCFKLSLWSIWDKIKTITCLCSQTNYHFCYKCFRRVMKQSFRSKKVSFLKKICLQ